MRWSRTFANACRRLREEAARIRPATQEQLDELLALARPTFPAPQYELLRQVLATFVFVMQALQNAKTSLTRFRKRLFGASTENGFDELKNQWGWGGYTTQDLERSNLSARAVALIYNWWSWYVRLAHPKTRLEAITSRPMLLAGVARLTQHAGQSRLLLTLSHAAGDQIKAMVTNIRKGLEHISATAPQLPKTGRWPALVRYIVSKILSARPKSRPPFALAPPGLAFAMG